MQGYRLLEAAREERPAGGHRRPRRDHPRPGAADADGIDLIRQVRVSHPIIVVSARTRTPTRWPRWNPRRRLPHQAFSVEELLARLRVATRRLAADAGADRDGPVYENGDLRIDYAARTVTLAGEEVHLTPIEYKLLALLARNTGKVLTHNAILKEVWGNALASDLPSLRVFMA
ncbi:MAG: winged helix-turn-helix domain-containing protein, partial [Eggerthellaceae bacterium]